MHGRLRTRLAATLTACFIGLSSGWAQPIDLNAAIDRTFDIYNSGEEENAMAFLQEAIRAEEGRIGHDPGLLAEAYFYLGRFRSQSGALPGAEEALRQTIALEDARGEAGRLSPLKIDAMDLLGQVVGRQGRLDNSAQIFGRVLQLQASAKGRTHPDRLQSMVYMAITFESADNLRAAEYYLRTAAGAATEAGLDADTTARYRSLLAENLDKQGKSAQAAEIRNGAAIVDIEGAFAAAIEEGEALRGTGRDAAAHEHFMRVAEEFEPFAGESPFYQLILKDIAETGDQTTGHAERARLYGRAAEIEESMLGVSVARWGEFRYWEARAYAFEGDVDRAFKGFDDLGRQSQWFDDTVNDRMRGVQALLAIAAGRAPAPDCSPVRPENADEMLYATYAIESMVRANGANAARVPVVDCGLSLGGNAASETARFAATMALGLALTETGQYDRAALILDEAHRLAQDAQRPPYEIRLLLGYKALAYGWTRKFDEAMALVDQAEALGPEGAERISLIRVRSVILVNAGRYLEAEGLIREALALISESGSDAAALDSERIDAVSDLATILARAGRAAEALSLMERIVLPEAPPVGDRKSELVRYVGVKEYRLRLLANLGDERARAAAEDFLIMARELSDSLLREADRNVILSATIASSLAGAAAVLATVDLNAEADGIAQVAGRLIEADMSEGVRLLGAQVEWVRAGAALIRGARGEALERYDHALALAGVILPETSDQMYQMWFGRGMARQVTGDAAGALSDLRSATQIALRRIETESRMAGDDGTQRVMRPSFESLVGAAWLAGNL